MKYPKPGYHNPIISVHVFELDMYRNAVAQGDNDAENHTIELDWTGETYRFRQDRVRGRVGPQHGVDRQRSQPSMRGWPCRLL